MTRFMMTLNDAVDLVIYAFEHGEMVIFSFRKHPPLHLIFLLKL